MQDGGYDGRQAHVIRWCPSYRSAQDGRTRESRSATSVVQCCDSLSSAHTSSQLLGAEAHATHAAVLAVEKLQ